MDDLSLPLTHDVPRELLGKWVLFLMLTRRFERVIFITLGFVMLKALV